MKVYGPDFMVYPISPYPPKAVAFDSIKAAKTAYEEFVQDCENFGQRPADAWLFIGEPDRDEEQYGYPDYPDFVIKSGPRGGVSVVRA